MKIKVSKGCMSSSVSIDGKDIDDLTTNQIIDAIVNVVVTFNRDDSIYWLKELVDLHGDVESTHRCETCGDTNEEYTLDVPDVWKIEWD